MRSYADSCGKDTGIGRFPSRELAINAAWLETSLTAMDLLAWTQTTLLDGELVRAEPKKLRYRLLHTAARITHGQRRVYLLSATGETDPAADANGPPSLILRGVLAVEDWAEIRRLHRAEGLPIKAIVRRLGVSRNAVRRALASAGPQRYSRPPRPSSVDAFEPAIRALLGEFPEMPASVIAERVGWSRSGSVLRARVAQLRPLFAAPDPASRTSYEPGGLAQCDLWLPPFDVPLGHGQVGRPPVLVMVTGYSRMTAA